MGDCTNVNSKETELKGNEAARKQLMLDDHIHVQRRDNHSPYRKWVFRILPVLGWLINLIVLVIVIVIASRRAWEQTHGEKNNSLRLAQVNFSEVCCDCLRLVRSPYMKLVEDLVLTRLTKRKEDGVMKCCAGNYTQMSAMLTAVARGQDRMKDALPDVYASSTKSSPVFVHKQMASESMNRLTGYSVVKFESNNNEAMKEQSQGAKILEDGIVILNAGMYYIYSNVFFNGNETGRKDSSQTWSSHVHRTSPQSNTKTGILLTSVHTRCYNCSTDKLSIFTGGVFQLQPGDLIRVFLSDVGRIHFNHISSYLGLTKLNR